MGAVVEAEMYPLVDNPTYETEYEDFTELREQIEGTSEGLNLIESWYIFDESSKYWDEDEVKGFELILFMPRKSQTGLFRTSVFERADVEEWINGYVKERTLRWFGWGE